MRSLVALLVLGLALPAGAGRRAETRRRCAAMCGQQVVACAASAPVKRCRRRVLKDCRRRGQGVVCPTTTTTTSSTSTTTTSVTTTSTTSTTHGFEPLVNTTWRFTYVIDDTLFVERMYFARVERGSDGETPILLGRDVGRDLDFVVTQPRTGLRYLLVEPVTDFTCFAYQFGLFPSGQLQGNTFTLDGTCLVVLDGPFPFIGTRQ